MTQYTEWLRYAPKGSIFVLRMVPTPLFDQLGEGDDRKTTFIGVFSTAELAIEYGYNLERMNSYWKTDIDYIEMDKPSIGKHSKL